MNACAIASRIRAHMTRLPSIRTVRLAVVCAIAAFAVVMPPARLAGQDRGCYLGFGALGNLPDLRSSSGNPQLDRAMIAEIRKVDRIFGINPAYSYFYDGSPQAYATTEQLVDFPGTQGTIIFGLNLIDSELNSEYGGAAVAGIAAHEGGHIYQFFRLGQDLSARLQNRPTTREFDLHADFLAGYYFAATGRTERSLVVFAEALFARGDYMYNHPQHHGTPDERVQAMRAGYRHGDLSVEEAATRGVHYVFTM